MIFIPKVIYPLSEKKHASDQGRFDYFRIDFLANRSPKIIRSTPTSLFYAENFLQSLDQEELKSFEGKTIEDWADLKCRGFMLDISRNRVPTMDWLKTLIEKLALLRYNELQLYTEHTFAYSGHEVVWKDASPITAFEIQELDQFCSERHIELIPNQNSFGHMERWLRHDTYRHLAESPNGFEHPISGWRDFGSTLYPCDESNIFLDTLYEELLPNFQSDQIHIGGDEPWELGKGRSAKTVEKNGKHIVYLKFVQQIVKTAQKYGKKPQLWADIILERPDLVPQLAKEVRPVIWGYEADSPFDENCRIVKEAGFEGEFYVAPGSGNWNSFSGRLDVARSNIQLAAQNGFKHRARGLLLTAWGDNGHHQTWPTLFAPLIIGGLNAWHTNAPITDTQLAKYINEIFYFNEKNNYGEVLCKLGQIDSLITQPLPPMSFLHAAFFNNKEEFNNLMLKISKEQIISAKNKLYQISDTTFDPEINLGIKFNKIAIERCLATIEQRNPTYKREKILKKFQIEFTKLWLIKSRQGGLKESIDKIKSALEE